MDATTTAKVKELLDIASSDTTHDAVLGRYVTSVSQRIETFIDRPFKSEARTEEYDIKPRQRVIFLRAYPLTAQNKITSIKIATDWKFSTTSAVNSEDYHVDYDTGAVHFNFTPITNYLGNNSATAPNAVQIAYTGGFAETTDGIIINYPAIAEACATQVVAMWRRRDQPHIKTTDVGDYTSTVEGPLRFLPDVVQALIPYRRMRFGQ